MRLLLMTPPELPMASALTASVQLATPLLRKTMVLPSLTTLPEMVTVAAWPVKMYVGDKATSGGDGGGEGGGGEGEGGGGEGEGGGGDGEGGGAGGDCGGGEQVQSTVPLTRTPPGFVPPN